MPKRKKIDRPYVKHPRYGDKPAPSGEKIPSEDLKRAHWRYNGLKIFPETAIRADVTKQNYAIYPRDIYVDIEEHCRNCGRPFLFFAREQKYWFEVLGFWVAAHCTKCVECRKKEHEIKWMQMRYQALVTLEERSITESKELKAIAMELYQLGYIKDVRKFSSDLK